MKQKKQWEARKQVKYIWDPKIVEQCNIEITLD